MIVQATLDILLIHMSINIVAVRCSVHNCKYVIQSQHNDLSRHNWSTTYEINPGKVVASTYTCLESTRLFSAFDLAY